MSQKGIPRDAGKAELKGKFTQLKCSYLELEAIKPIIQDAILRNQKKKSKINPKKQKKRNNRNKNTN